jgi:hypothetical protein
MSSWDLTLANSGDISDGHSGGEEEHIHGIQWVEARVPLNDLPCTGQPHHRAQPNPKAEATEREALP